MSLHRSMCILALALAACGDDPASPSNDVTTAPDAVADDLGGDGDDTANVVPDVADDASDDTTTTAPDVADDASDDTTTTAPDVADDASEDTTTCTAASSTELFGKFAPTVTAVDGLDADGVVRASAPCVSFASHADTHVVLGRNAADTGFALVTATVSTADLAAGDARVIIGSFAPGSGDSVRVTRGPMSPQFSTGSVQRLPVDDAALEHALRPPNGSDMFRLPAADVDARSFVFGLNGLAGQGDADWVELEGQMAVRVFQFSVGPQHIYLNCQSAASCAADVQAGTASDLGSDNSLATWAVVPKTATVKLYAKSTGDGSTTVDGEVVSMGAAGDYHTILGFNRADGLAIWQEFATAPPADGRQVVDIYNANPIANLQFWLENRAGTLVLPATFSAPIDMPWGAYRARAYAGVVDLAANDPAPYATLDAVVLAGRDAAWILAPSAVAQFAFTSVAGLPLADGEAGALPFCATSQFTCSFEMVTRGSCDIDPCGPRQPASN